MTTGQLRRWVDEGLLSEKDAEEVDAILDLLIFYVRRGAITPRLAMAIVQSLAEEKASRWDTSKAVGQ